MGGRRGERPRIVGDEEATAAAVLEVDTRSGTQEER